MLPPPLPAPPAASEPSWILDESSGVQRSTMFGYGVSVEVLDAEHVQARVETTAVGPLQPSLQDAQALLTRLLAPACRSGRAITIEITERENVIITDTLLADIGELRTLGCKLALDDFGSGYSTYQFLNLFRPEYLKIEGAFVRGMLDNEADRKIVEHIHDLAVSFGISTIAESVENEDTCLALLDLGIHNAQGFHLGSPELHHL